MYEITVTRGFTLVELLIVIVVLGILAAIIAVGYREVEKKAKNAVIQQKVSDVSKALSAYRAATGSFPMPTGFTWQPYSMLPHNGMTGVCISKDNAGKKYCHIDQYSSESAGYNGVMKWQIADYYRDEFAAQGLTIPSAPAFPRVMMKVQGSLAGELYVSGVQYSYYFAGMPVTDFNGVFLHYPQHGKKCPKGDTSVDPVMLRPYNSYNSTAKQILNDTVMCRRKIGTSLAGA